MIFLQIDYTLSAVEQYYIQYKNIDKIIKNPRRNVSFIYVYDLWDDQKFLKMTLILRLSRGIWKFPNIRSIDQVKVATLVQLSLDKQSCPLESLAISINWYCEVD